MFGSILGGVSAVAGLLDKGGDVQSAPTSGYQTYPQWLKDIYEETAAPAILEQFNKPYEVLPMARYEADPNDPFTSQALLELQAYSDATGGFFQPYSSGQNALGASNDAASAAQAAELKKMQDEMAAQAWVNRQMASYLPNTRQHQQLSGIKDMSSLGELLSMYEDKQGMEAPSYNRLNMQAQGNPDMQELFRGMY